MMLFEYIRIAFAMLWAHRVRSLLTVISITVGAFSIVLMTSLAESGFATLWSGIEGIGGARLVSVFPKPPERAKDKLESYTGGVTDADWDEVFVDLPHVVEQARFTKIGRSDVLADSGRPARTDVVAGDSEFLTLFRMRLGQGRGFSDAEDRRYAHVCVVGHELAMKLWDGDAMGRWLTVEGQRCQVIGQLANQERWAVSFGFDWQDLVVLPLRGMVARNPLARRGVIEMVKTDSPSANDIVKRIVNTRLVERHNGVDDFIILDFARMMERFTPIFSIMRAIVGFIAGIALLVGGIGVMNMMLVSVNERVQEIGIRKALGATPGDILWQFLCEASVLSGVGGAVGVGLGVVMAQLASLYIRQLKPVWISVVSESAVLWALAVSLGVGLVFGIFPARRAARLDAIQAIRR